MKRFLVIVCFFIVGIVSANPTTYPAIAPENVVNLQEVGRYGTGRMTYGVAWSPDGSKLAVAGSYGIFYYENIEAEPEFIELDLGTDAAAPFFATDSLLFFRVDRKLVAYELNERRILYEVDGNMALAVSNNRQMLAYAYNSSLRVLDIANGNLLYDLNHDPIIQEERLGSTHSGWDANFLFVQFSPDDTALLVGWQAWLNVATDSAPPVLTHVWSLESLEAMSLQEWNTEAADDANIAVRDSTGRIFTANLETLISQTTDGYYLNGTYSFAGTHLAVIYSSSVYNDEDREGFTGIWDTQTGELVTNIADYGVMSFSHDGTKIAINNTIYALPSGDVVRTLISDGYHFVGNPPERVLRFHDNEIQLLDALSFQLLMILPFARDEWYLDPRAETDGSFILLRQDDSEFMRLNSLTGEVMTVYRASPNVVYQYASPDLTYVYGAGSEDKMLWNYETGAIIYLPPSFEIVSPIFHPNGAVVIWDSSAEEVYLYDAMNATILADFPFEGAVSPKLKFSPDGRYMLLGNGDIREVWDVDEQLNLFDTDVYSGTYTFSRDSQYLVTLIDRDHVRIIQLNDGSIRRQMNIGNAVLGLQSISPNSVCAFYSTEQNIPGHWCFDIPGGDYIPYPAASSFATSFAESNSLFFSHNYYELIISTQTEILWQEPIREGLFAIALSSDGSRIYVNYFDDRLGIWAVEE